MKRGEVWWASLTEPLDSEPGYRRPVVIVQSDQFNESRIGTVIATAVTTNLRRAGAPGNVLLRRQESGLPRDSVANVSQLITVSKRFLTERAGRLSSQRMRELDEGLRLVLAL